MSRLYTAELLDMSGNRVVVLENIHNTQWRRQFNRANVLNFAFPASDAKKSELSIARSFNLYRDDDKVARGKITRRDFSGNPLVLSSMSPEILLEGFQTPPAWGEVWEGQELRDVLDDLLSEYELLYANTQSDFEAGVDSSQVDTSTEPGKLMLATQAGTDGATGLPTRTYYSSGYVTLQFDCGTHDGFERLRWTQEIGDVVHVKVAYRTSADAVTWSAWSSDLENRVDADTKGIDLSILLSGNTDRYIQVKVTLTTEDTSNTLYSWDDAGVYGEQVYGFTPIFEGLELVYRKAGTITMHADVPVTFGTTVRGVTANSEKHLGVLIDLAEAYGLEFYVDPDLKLHVAERPQGVSTFVQGTHLGTDRSNEVLFIEGENTSIDVLEDDDSELVNVLYCYGAGRGPGQLTLSGPLIDQDSIDTYGERPGTFVDTSITDRATLQAKGQAYLNEHKDPKQSFRVRTLWTDDMPELGAGDLVRVVVPESETVTTARILDIDYSETTDGEVLTLGLNTNLRNLLDRLSDAEARLQRTPKPPAVAPDAPTQFRAGEHYGYVSLSWVGAGDFYVLEHSTDGSTWSILETRLTETRYSHTGLTPGSVHYYRVARSKDGLLSAFTTKRKATVLDEPEGTSSGSETIPSTAPTILVGKKALSVLITGASTWAVDEYVLERSEATADYDATTNTHSVPASPSWGAWAPVTGGEFKGNNYVDHNVAYDKAYRYRYKAKFIGGGESGYSNASAGAVPDRMGLEDAYYQWIQAEHYVNVRNFWHEGSLEPIDGSKDIIFDFYIPGETSHIESIKLSAKGLKYRAYATAAEIWDAFGTATSTEDVDHTHSFTTTSASTSIDGAHMHSYTAPGSLTDSAGSHSHTISTLSYSTGTDGSHSHSYSAPSSSTGSAGSHSHSVNTTGSTSGSNSGGGISSTEEAGDPFGGSTPDKHSHGIGGFSGAAPQGHTHSYNEPSSTNSTGSHSHSVTTTSSSTESAGSHSHTYDKASSISTDGAHTHGINTSAGTTGSGGSHSHTYDKLSTISSTGFGDTDHSHEVNLSHSHSLVFGIFEDTTPASVRLYTDNGSGWVDRGLLAGAPDSTTDYILTSDKDLTSYFADGSGNPINGTGWKRIRFTSSRRGRINYKLLFHIDVTA